MKKSEEKGRGRCNDIDVIENDEDDHSYMYSGCLRFWTVIVKWENIYEWNIKHVVRIFISSKNYVVMIISPTSIKTT